ncbi:Amino-transferase class IV [anaerobic digester metagenome]|uniref:aminotransferase class IV n=1 Tax=Desulfovibrio desulfuricans TaxID=876 RepID=UPI001F29EE99|nr:aminotransferase class IV [Desulfovibrio desulfuricans]UIB00475.1 aminotransferase class IV [Desulfovibrio desulfuricans]
MQAVDAETYLKALLSAPRPGSEQVLAFYDHRVGHICTDPRLLLLPLDDHICHRGDGLFESISFRQRTIFGLDAHLARLVDGATALSITPPCTWEALRQRIIDVALAAGVDNGDLRVFLSRGPGGFGISPAECPQAGLYIVALKKALPTAAFYEKGLTAFASAIPPKQEYLARIKNTNYLPNVFMAMEARQKGMDVAVTFDENGIMGEAAVANVGLVDAEGRLLCPEIRRILPGTTLLAAMEVAAERMPVVQMPIPRTAIDSASEMLLFTSSTLCVGITHFDGKPVGHGAHAGKPGPVALWLKDVLLDYMLKKGAPL